METELSCSQTDIKLWDPTIFVLWVMESENWITETGHPNKPLKSTSNLAHYFK